MFGKKRKLTFVGAKPGVSAEGIPYLLALFTCDGHHVQVSKDIYGYHVDVNGKVKFNLKNQYEVEGFIKAEIGKYDSDDIMDWM